jgi:hypothetical protein
MAELTLDRFDARDTPVDRIASCCYCNTDTLRLALPDVCMAMIEGIFHREYYLAKFWK